VLPALLPLLLLIPPGLSSAGPAPLPDPVRDVERSLRRVPAGGARASAATRPLLGAPYLASPLGEGGGDDPDPRFRLDAFDCMTFVETAIALGSAASLPDARRVIDDVRYGGPPARGARNHEVLSQWIPRNLEKGWIAELTRTVAGERARRVEKTYTPASWQAVRRAGRAIPGLPRRRLPLGSFGVDLVAPDEVEALAPVLPEGAIVFVVRVDREDRATRVTHAGLVVLSANGARRIRHATSSGSVGRVIEEPIARFVQRELRAWPRWPVEGLAFFAIPDASARTLALGAGPARPAPARAGARSEGPAPAPPL
jgi:hypothetical protein